MDGHAMSRGCGKDAHTPALHHTAWQHGGLQTCRAPPATKPSSARGGRHPYHVVMAGKDAQTQETCLLLHSLGGPQTHRSPTAAMPGCVGQGRWTQTHQLPCLKSRHRPTSCHASWEDCRHSRPSCHHATRCRQRRSSRGLPVPGHTY